MKKIIMVGMSACFFLLTNAQEKTLNLSLKEAVDFAIENSYNTKASKNNIKSAHKKVWETTTIGLPQIGGKVEYQNWIKQQVNLADFNGDGTDEVFVFGKKTRC